MSDLEEKTLKHPCYNCAGHKYARIHLAVAPKCNISCNYCLRKYDCVNESRPGVTTEVLEPEAALERFLEVREKVDNLTVVGIAGPGDALANFDKISRTLKLIREYAPGITFCVSTNGLMLPKYADSLAALGVTHVTVTMNTVNPEIGGKIYRYVDYEGRRYTGTEAGQIILHNQLEGLKRLQELGIVCKVNIIMMKGINDKDIPNVVKKAKELGVMMTNITRMIPVEGSVFENLEAPTCEELQQMRSDCGIILKQMMHCRQCRADAVGTLDNDVSHIWRKKEGLGEARIISEYMSPPPAAN